MSTMHPNVRAYLLNLLSLDERIESASFAVAHDSADEERNGRVVAVERPRAFGVVRFANGLVWGSNGVAGINSLFAADEIAPAENELWQEIDGACSDDAINVLRSLDETDDGDAWTLYRAETRAA